MREVKVEKNDDRMKNNRDCWKCVHSPTGELVTWGAGGRLPWACVNLTALSPDHHSRDRLWPPAPFRPPLSSASLLHSWEHPWLTLAILTSRGLDAREVAVFPALALFCCPWEQALRSCFVLRLYTYLWRDRARATNIRAVFKRIIFTWFLHFSSKVHGSWLLTEMAAGILPPGFISLWWDIEIYSDGPSSMKTLPAGQ